MEYNEDSLLDSGAPWSDREGFKRHLDSNMHYIPNVNMDELQAELQAERDEYVKAKRIADMGYALGDLPGSEFISELESESESDFNKYAVQEEAFKEAKKDPSQPDSHDSGAHWSDREGFKHHLDSNMHYIPNANMGELQDKFQAARAEYLETKRKDALGYYRCDIPGSPIMSESESVSESDFNKYAVQEEAFREAKKDPSQPDSHDSTEEEKKKKKDAC